MPLGGMRPARPTRAIRTSSPTCTRRATTSQTYAPARPPVCRDTARTGWCAQLSSACRAARAASRTGRQRVGRVRALPQLLELSQQKHMAQADALQAKIRSLQAQHSTARRQLLPVGRTLCGAGRVPRRMVYGSSRKQRLPL